ncbi:hypothetical protein MKW94_020246 [Papaver nudicaule]|uniref:GATA-type domain-containing protein n=1 Tax=Papaver nudicaule TaxID=74823 RepID=A0AA41S8I0_PAPNU|nr:hypothetical protein [Papaver nudicaule]
MTDLTEKGSGSDTTKKTCVDCQTSKTPLWRGGPAGPKSLCNACGIRLRKKRSEVLRKEIREKHEMIKKKDKKRDHHQKIQIQMNNKKNNKISACLKLRLLAFGREVMLQRSAMGSSRQQLGEEEQAAVLLMALSCGSVYA